jgi:hypothetical protein
MSIRATPPVVLAEPIKRIGEKIATASITDGMSLPACDARSIAPRAGAGNS